MIYSVRKFPMLTFKSEQEWLDQLATDMHLDLVSVVYKANTNETIYYFRSSRPTPPIGLVDYGDNIKVKRSRPVKRKIPIIAV